MLVAVWVLFDCPPLLLVLRGENEPAEWVCTKGATSLSAAGNFLLIKFVLAYPRGNHYELGPTLPYYV
jgi:hypothetical protein